MPDFNPANALIRVAHEAVPGILPLDAAAWVDHRMTGETVSMETTEIEDDSIVNNAQAQEGYEGPIAVNGDINVVLHPEGHLRYLGNLQKKVDTTNPDSGVYIHRFAPSGGTSVPSTLANWISRDDGMPQNLLGGRVLEAELTLETANLLRSRFGMNYSRAGYFGPPVQLADSGGSNTDVPRVRGLPAHADWITADGDITIKASDVTGAPDEIEVLVKQAPDAYGVIPTTILVGNDDLGNPIWNTLYDSTTGAIKGTRAMPIQMSLASTTNWAVNDEYRFDRERGVWTPSYSAAPAFNVIYAYVLIDGVEYCIQQFSLTITRGLTPEECIGGRFPKSVQELGARAVTLSLQRKAIDTTIRKRLEAAKSFVFRLECYSGEEIETGYEHQLIIVCPKVKLNGRSYSAESKDSMPENIEGTCYPDPTNGDGFVDDCTIIVQNSIASAVAT